MRTWVAVPLLLAPCLLSFACVPDDSSRSKEVEIVPGMEWRYRENVVDQPPAPMGDCPEYGSPEYAGIPGEGVTFLDFPIQQSRSNAAWGAVLTDIVNHLPASYGSMYWSSDQITCAHETTHGISEHLRNNYNPTSAAVNAFYFGDDRAAIVAEPNIQKSEVADYVPASLRGEHFDDVVVGQTQWDDRPLYLFDEWNALTNEAATGLDLVEHGLWSGGTRDVVAGQLELTVYALATAKAIEAHDPSYFTENKQFKEVLAFQLSRAMEINFAGRRMTELAGDAEDAYLDALVLAPDAEPIRAFARRVFGERFANERLFGMTYPGCVGAEHR